MPRNRAPAITPMLITSTPLTVAELLALDVTGIVLIDPPGAGKLIVVFGVAAVFALGTRAYFSVYDTLSVDYDNASLNSTLFSNINGIVTNPAPSQLWTPGEVAVDPSNATGNAGAGVIVSALSSFVVGPVVTATVGAGGTGYAPNDTGIIATDSGDAHYKVLTVSGLGAVLTFSITAPGTLYTVGNLKATATGAPQAGIGINFTVDITAVQTGDGTLKLVTLYQIIDVP